MKGSKNRLLSIRRKTSLAFGRFMKRAENSMASKSYLRHSPILWTLLIALSICAELLLGCSEAYFAVPIDFACIPAAAAAFIFGNYGLLILIPSVIARHLVLFGLRTSPAIIAGDLAYIVGMGILIAATASVSRNYSKALAYERRFSKDIEMARITQRTLLPKVLEMGGVRISGYIHQCMEVGGDFYYFRPFMKKYVLIAIGDVMGKGITASFVSSIIMGIFYEWGKKTHSPSAIFSRINQRLISIFNESRFFSTIMYGVFNEESSEFTYAGAGHAGILISPDGKCSIMESCGLPVGMYPNTKWKDEKIRLEKGSRILLFTDGITEARNKDGEFYGMERVIRTAESHSSEPVEKIKDAIISDVCRFSGGESQGDDRAIVIMELANPSVQAAGNETRSGSDAGFTESKKEQKEKE